MGDLHGEEGSRLATDAVYVFTQEIVKVRGLVIAVVLITGLNFNVVAPVLRYLIMTGILRGQIVSYSYGGFLSSMVPSSVFPPVVPPCKTLPYR